jgi:UDP-N-acetyl-D-glucosamine dehydrogenase
MEIKNIIKKIKSKKSKIGIIGMGYVGLPLAVLFSKKKFTVYGFDINKQKVNLLKKISLILGELIIKK